MWLMQFELSPPSLSSLLHPFLPLPSFILPLSHSFDLYCTLPPPPSLLHSWSTPSGDTCETSQTTGSSGSLLSVLSSFTHASHSFSPLDLIVLRRLPHAGGGGEGERRREGVEVGWTKNASKGRMRGMEREKEWEYVSKLTQTNLYNNLFTVFGTEYSPCITSCPPGVLSCPTSALLILLSEPFSAKAFKFHYTSLQLQSYVLMSYRQIFQAQINIFRERWFRRTIFLGLLAPLWTNFCWTQIP